jgi:hypothetical protein
MPVLVVISLRQVAKRASMRQLTANERGDYGLGRCIRFPIDGSINHLKELQCNHQDAAWRATGLTYANGGAREYVTFCENFSEHPPFDPLCGFL